MTLEKFLYEAQENNINLSKIKKECLTPEWFEQNYTTKEKTKLILICSIHGEYQQSISQFLKGKRCRKCANSNNSKKRKLSKKDIIKKLKKLSKNKLFKKIKIINLKKEINNYQNKNQKIKIKCLKNNLIFERSWDQIFKMLLPKKCLDRRKTFKQFLEKFTQKKLNKKFWIKFDKNWWDKNYKNTTTRNLKFKCKNCKQEILKSYDDLITLNTGCSYCSPNTFLSYEKFLRKLKETENYKSNKYDYSLITEEWWQENYINSQNTKIPIICPTHGIFYQNAFDHLHENGCPKCSKEIKESKGERKIRLFLEKNNINFIQEYKVPDSNLRFDFYLPDYNLAIEYDGIQHFKSKFEYSLGQFKETKKRDFLKNKLCHIHNINLLRIPYWDFKKIDEILDQALKKA